MGKKCGESAKDLANIVGCLLSPNSPSTPPITYQRLSDHFYLKIADKVPLPLRREPRRKPTD